MKRFNFNNKPLVESPYPPQDTNMLWVDVDENTDKVISISAFKNGEWKIILQKTTDGLYKAYVIRKKDISNCTYNMVDLGLPSGLKWADRNVGAEHPEDFGSYFQWGDTDGYTCEMENELAAAELAARLQPWATEEEIELTAENVHEFLNMMFEEILYELGLSEVGFNLRKFGLGFPIGKTFDDWGAYKYCNGSEYSLTKYNTDSARGVVDNKAVLDLSDDAANVHMGFNWRMPTKEDIEELIKGTTITVIDVQGNEYTPEYLQENDIYLWLRLKGIRLTSIVNNNSIFIPAGDCISWFIASEMCSVCYIWSSTLEIEAYSSNAFQNNQNGINLCISADGDIGEGCSPRTYGIPVRGVHA